MMKVSQCKGFSLLELAVSLTIIGLLVAAIVAGQNIKSRLELNQVITDVTNISKALIEFENQHGSLAGDMWNAEDVFGSGNTNNGNGNGELTDIGASDERLLYWQHLSLAGYLEGSYDGVTDGDGGRFTSTLKASLIGADTLWPRGGGTHGDAYLYVEKTSAGNGLFTIKEAYDFDTKYDDSMPRTGAIRATDGADTGVNSCITGSDTYDLTNSAQTPCVLNFF